MITFNSQQQSSTPETGESVRKSTVRLNNAALVSSLTDIGHRIAHSEDKEHLFRDVLVQLGETLRVTRAVLIETIQEPNGTLMNIREEWIAASASQLVGNELGRTGLSMEKFGLEFWKNQFRMEKTVSGLSADAPLQERRYLETFAIRSFAAVPISYEGIWWGFLEVDDGSSWRVWDKAALAYLEGVAALIANALKIQTQQEQIEQGLADLTEHRLVARALVREVEEVRKWKNAVFSSFSHEFQTPLYTLLGFSATLLDNATLDDDPEIRHTCLQHIYEQASRLDRLVKEMMELSSLQAKSSNPAFEEIDLAPLIEAVAMQYREKAEGQHVSLYLEMDGRPMLVACDESRIRTMLSHLLAFSISCTPDAGWVSVRAASDEGAVILDISDNGPGIPEEQTSRLFEPFYWLHDGARNTTGTGLGLSIAKDIVDLHGGFITVESKPDEGISFRITLPRKPV